MPCEGMNPYLQYYTQALESDYHYLATNVAETSNAKRYPLSRASVWL